jgi:hypothetical protein
MKKILFKILLRLLEPKYNTPLSEGEIDSLLTRLATEEGLQRLPAFLDQCANTYRNQYLYSGNEMLKGSVLAFVALRERIMEKKKPKKLTSSEESGKIRESY